MTDNAPTNYLSAMVGSPFVTEFERTFCASLIRQERAGRRLSDKQAATLRGIVERFQQRSMKDDDWQPVGQVAAQIAKEAGECRK